MPSLAAVTNFIQYASTWRDVTFQMIGANICKHGVDWQAMASNSRLSLMRMRSLNSGVFILQSCTHSSKAWHNCTDLVSSQLSTYFTSQKQLEPRGPASVTMRSMLSHSWNLESPWHHKVQAIRWRPCSCIVSFSQVSAPTSFPCISLKLSRRQSAYRCAFLHLSKRLAKPGARRGFDKNTVECDQTLIIIYSKEV